MIFNKDGNGSDELYKLSGTFQASTDFNAIISEIESAQAEVSDIVGCEVVNEAETVYAKENPTAEETSFLQAVQRAVAFLAISRYARLTGLSHGDTGRKIKTDENEKKNEEPEMPAEETPEEQDKEDETNCTAEGMCIGMLFGMSIGLALDNMVTGMCVGMLFGMVIGSGVKKHKK